MVFRRSEYRKQYRAPVWDSHFGHYQEKVDYRTHRRRLEHHHQIIDWDWDSENGEDDGGRPWTAAPAVANNANNNNQEGSGRGLRGKHRGGGEALDERVHQTPEWSRLRDDPAPVAPSGRREGGDPQPPEQRNMEQIKDSQPAQSSHKQQQHSSGQRKQRSKDRTQARPSTSPGQRVDTKKPRAVDRPPLVAFGWADRELATGDKRTHNIRASANVYPSALRAMRRRELDIQRQTSKDLQRHNLRELKLKALFNVPPRDDTVWLTEYRRNFAGPASPR